MHRPKDLKKKLSSSTSPEGANAFSWTATVFKMILLKFLANFSVFLLLNNRTERLIGTSVSGWTRPVSQVQYSFTPVRGHMTRLTSLISRCDPSLLVTGSLGVSGFQMMSRRSWRKYPKRGSQPSWPVTWRCCCLMRTTSRRWGRPARSSQRRDPSSMWLQRLQEQAGRPAGTENTDDLITIFTHISYCYTTWSHTSENNLKPIKSLFKRTLKTPDKKPTHYHYCKIINRYKILEFDSYQLFLDVCLIFKVLNGLAPPLLQAFIKTKYSRVNTRALSRGDCDKQRRRTKFCQMVASIRGTHCQLMSETVTVTPPLKKTLKQSLKINQTCSHG